MSKEQFRAVFDAHVVFSNGGDLHTEGFRVDVGSELVSEAEVGELFVRSLNLLMVESVEILNLRVIREAHKGTHGGPSDAGGFARERRLVELNHVIHAGMTTYPGLPVPRISSHLSREDSRAIYAAGTEFTIDAITMVGNTGTYLDAPFHRYRDGADLAGVGLESLVDLPAVLVRASSHTRAIDVATLAPYDVRGAAVLLHTGADERWGSDAYVVDSPYLSDAGARWLVEHGARLVGIDAFNIDDVKDPTRPAHSVLLAGGVPIVEHLTGLDQLPATGALFSAAPARVAGFGTFPVRAYASIPVATVSI